MLLLNQNIPLESLEFPFDTFEGTGITEEEQFCLHNHDCLELNYCVSGKGEYHIGDKKYEIRKGDLFVINNQEYHIAVNKGNLCLKIIVFSPEMIWKNHNALDSKYLQTFYAWKENFRHRFSSDMLIVEQITVLFYQIQNEYEKKEEGYRLVVKALLLQILALLYRAFSASDSNIITKFQSDYNKIIKAVSYIDENFNSDIKLEHLAKISNFAPNYFSKIWGNVMSVSVSTYINKKRIEHSCMLLNTTDMNIVEIALKSGFNDISHFNKTFKSILNTTPKSFRNSKIKN